MGTLSGTNDVKLEKLLLKDGLLTIQMDGRHGQLLEKLVIQKLLTL